MYYLDIDIGKKHSCCFTCWW